MEGNTILNLKIKSRAQILVETIIGIGVVGILLSAIIPLFLVGLKAGPEAWKQDIAWSLGQEQIEAAHTLAADNWNNIYRADKGVNLHLVNSGGAWQINPTAAITTINNIEFTKKIVIDNVKRLGTYCNGDIDAGGCDDPATQKITATVSWPGSLAGISIEDYLTRNVNATWVQEGWQGGSGQAIWSDITQYFSDSGFNNLGIPVNPDVDGTSQAGILKIAQFTAPGSSPFGNQFLSNSLISRTVRSNPNQTTRLAMRFTAQNTGSVDQVRIYNPNNGTNTTFRFGLQTESAGQPSGSWVGGVSATANFNNQAAGWRTVNLGGSASVTAGTVYYLIIQHESGNQTLTVRVNNPLNSLVSQDMTVDNNLNVREYTNGAWTGFLNYNPIYLLRLTGSPNTYEGMPYDNRLARTISNGNTEAEVFTVSQDTTINGVAIYGYKNNNDPGVDLMVTLYDEDDLIYLVPQESFATWASMSTTLGWVTHSFSGGSVTLPANHQFRLTFSSTAAANRAYTVIANSNTPNTAEYRDLTWEGQTSYESRNGGTSLGNDLVYYLNMGSTLRYQDYGEVISSSFDTENPQGAGYNRLTVTLSEALPVGTMVKVQLATNNDNATWNYLGPNGTGGDWYEMSVGDLTRSWVIPPSFYSTDEARYLRYKLRLESTTPFQVTPKVDWMRMNYSP